MLFPVMFLSVAQVVGAVSVIDTPGAIVPLDLLPVGETNQSNIWVRSSETREFDVAAAKKECDATGECEVVLFDRSDRFEFFFVRTCSPLPSTTRLGFVSLVSRDLESGTAVEAWSVEFRASLARAGTPAVYSTPLGEILEVPIEWSGTAHYVTRLLFLWESGRWIEIDGLTFETELELPPCYEIWKAPQVDLETFSAVASVGIRGDGGCCPTGGKLFLSLDLVDRQIQVVESIHDVTATGNGRPGSPHEEWRQPYLRDCMAETEKPLQPQTD